MTDHPTPMIAITVDPTNPGQYFACCGLLELADRLWPQSLDRPAAEGWFAGNQFMMDCGGELKELLKEAQRTKFAGDAEEEAEEDDEDGDEADSAEINALVMIEPVEMLLDWWGDKSLKPWAGSMSARNIALAMSHAIDPDHPDPFNQSQIVPEFKENPKRTKGGKLPRLKPKEPFHFDARRGANALGRDVGFIHDTLKKKWKTPMFAHPVVEFFAFLGLQRCRPASTVNVRVHEYCTWTFNWRCQTCVAPIAVAGTLGDPQARRFRFANAFRTGKKRHKAYMPATPLPTGENT